MSDVETHVFSHSRRVTDTAILYLCALAAQQEALGRPASPQLGALMIGVCGGGGGVDAGIGVRGQRFFLFYVYHSLYCCL